MSARDGDGADPATGDLYALDQELEARLDAVTRELAETSGRLDAMADGSSAGILIENAQGLLVRVNSPLIALLRLPALAADVYPGTPTDQITGAAKELFVNPDEFVASTNRIVANGAATRGERLIMKDGRVVEREYAPVGGEHPAGG